MKINIRKPLAFSEIGNKDNQEDCICPSLHKLNKECRFFILCDGMGGHDNGEVASATVCSALSLFFEKHIPIDDIVSVEYFQQALAYAYDVLDKKDTGGLKKMGTTMTCLYLHRGGYLVAHIGDSRIYHIRPDNTDLMNKRLGVIYQSADHSLVNDLLKVGELTEDDAKNFPQKNIITRAMQPNLEHRHRADVFSFSDIKSGDYFFLCSDGVLEQLTNERLCEILSDNSKTDSEKLESIRQVCYGKTKDNFTCFLIPIDKVTEEDSDIKYDDNIIAEVVLEEDISLKENVPQYVKTVKKRFHLFKLSLIILLAILLLFVILMWFSRSNRCDSREEPNIKNCIKISKIAEVEKYYPSLNDEKLTHYLNK